MTSSQLSTSKHGEVGHYPISTPLKPLTSMSTGQEATAVSVLSSTKNVPHRPEDGASNLQDRDQSSAFTQHSVAGSTLSETLVPSTGRTGNLGTQSDKTQAVNNKQPFDGDYYSHPTSEPYVQPNPSDFTDEVESATQREEEVKSSKDQATGFTEDIDQPEPVTELPYRGLMLPIGLFEPVDWHGDNNPPSPELMHLSSMDNQRLNFLSTNSQDSV